MNEEERALIFELVQKFLKEGCQREVRKWQKRHRRKASDCGWTQDPVIQELIKSELEFQMVTRGEEMALPPPKPPDVEPIWEPRGDPWDGAGANEK